MTERRANRTNVELDDRSEKQSADKTGLEENRTKIEVPRNGTTTRPDVKQTGTYSACQPEDGCYQAFNATPQRVKRE
jgi:hypothetical protein